MFGWDVAISIKPMQLSTMARERNLHMITFKLSRGICTRIVSVVQTRGSQGSRQFVLIAGSLDPLP